MGAKKNAEDAKGGKYSAQGTQLQGIFRRVYIFKERDIMMNEKQGNKQKLQDCREEIS